MGWNRVGVVAGASLTQFMVIGLFFSFGLFLPTFEAEFGWSRTFLSICSAVGVFMMGTLAMVLGPLADRIGPARVLVVAGLCYAAGWALMGQVTAEWQLFVLFATLLAVGFGAHDVVTLSPVARWFAGRRGVMTAIVKVGTALGQITVPPLAAYLILRLGWREALVVLAVLAGIVLVLAALMMRRPPAAVQHAAAEHDGMSYIQARQSRVFWTFCAIQFLFFPTMMTVPLHLPVHGIDMGLTTEAAALLLSVIGASSIAGRLLVGVVLDRIGGKNAFALCLLVLMVGLAGLMATTVPQTLYVTTAFYGFAHGGLFVVVSPTVAEYFGMRAHGAIFGSVLFFGTIGGSVGPILAGAVFDQTGGYFWAFATLFVSTAIAFVLLLSLPGRRADSVAA